MKTDNNKESNNERLTLIQKEQIVLDDVIKRLDDRLYISDKDIEKSMKMAQEARDSGVPEAYGTLVVARREQIIKEKNTEPIRRARKHLYNHHIILEDRLSVEPEKLDLKVGWVTCHDSSGKMVTIDYREEAVYPFIGSDYTDENASEAYSYHLLSKVKDTIADDQITDAKELYSAYSGKVNFYDDFLDNLLLHREEPYFQNIIFSIKNKQREIITEPFDQNILVQGCAGSGKSMIMFHRLPIILFRNSDTVDLNDISVITPSSTYMAMVQKLLHELDIENVYMGTLEEYYNSLIERYNYDSKLYRYSVKGKAVPKELEQRIYSSEIVEHINDTLFTNYSFISDPCSKGVSFFKMNKPASTKRTVLMDVTQKRETAKAILNAQTDIIHQYRDYLSDALKILKDLHTMLFYRERIIRQALHIGTFEEPTDEQKKILNNKSYFDYLKRLAVQIEMFFKSLLLDLDQIDDISDKDVYRLRPQKFRIIDAYNNWASFFSNYLDPYSAYGESFSSFLKKSEPKVNQLKEYTVEYLPLDYVCQVEKFRDDLRGFSASIVDSIYETIMIQLGFSKKNGKLTFLKCSPYLFLQCISAYRGSVFGRNRKIIAIDEAQNLEKTELDLIKRVNGKETIINLYGDINQHIEGSKGVESWKDLLDLEKFSYHTLEENYRNAVPITEYCNDHLKTRMRAICVDGPDVYCGERIAELNTVISDKLQSDFYNEANGIIVKDREEAVVVEDYLKYKQIPFKNHLFEAGQLEYEKWNLMLVEDVKGIEFKRALVFDRNMTQSEKYISYTRALDELLIYRGNI